MDDDEFAAFAIRFFCLLGIPFGCATHFTVVVVARSDDDDDDAPAVPLVSPFSFLEDRDFDERRALNEPTTEPPGTKEVYLQVHEDATL